LTAETTRKIILDVKTLINKIRWDNRRREHLTTDPVILRKARYNMQSLDKMEGMMDELGNRFTAHYEKGSLSPSDIVFPIDLEKFRGVFTLNECASLCALSESEIRDSLAIYGMKVLTSILATMHDRTDRQKRLRTIFGR
jgi:hypothetical protein